MSALNPTPAEKYFREMEDDLRRVERKMPAIDANSEAFCASANQMANIAWLAWFLADDRFFRPFMEETIGSFQAVDPEHRGKQWNEEIIECLCTELREERRKYDVPSYIDASTFESAVRWLFWYVMRR